MKPSLSRAPAWRACLSPHALLLFADTAAAGNVTSSLMIPLNESVYVQATAVPEWVDLTGRLHLVTQVNVPGDACIPTDPCRGVRNRVHANLAEVSAVGRSSGETYRANGATRFAMVVDLPGPPVLQGGFRLHPPNPVTPQGATLTVNINLELNETGQASEAAAAASPLSWWPGEGNALDAVGLNHGVAGEGVEYVEGRGGMAFGFDTTGYVTVPASESLQPTEVSVLAWVRAEERPEAFAYVLSKGASGCAAASYALFTGASGGLQFYIADGVHADLSPDAGTDIWDG